MPKTAAKAKADAKYDKKTYDRLVFLVRRDTEINGDFIRSYVASRGESMNGFFRRAVMETISRDDRIKSDSIVTSEV